MSPAQPPLFLTGLKGHMDRYPCAWRAPQAPTSPLHSREGGDWSPHPTF